MADEINIPENDVFFEIETPMGFRVRVTKSYWELIVKVKHPVMAGRALDVKEALVNPEEIRRSRSDLNVYLFYKLERAKRWICVVIKRLNGEGFLMTTYPTDTIKEGTMVWPK